MADARIAVTAKARHAEALAARLPPLLLAAERVAATVAQGVHGRRRVGTGDSFWQFRPFVTGDPATRIAWRQSAKSGRPAPQGWFVRETEWEAAQTVCLWRDESPSMRWRSPLATTEKSERAALLLLALAALVLRGGERAALIGMDLPPVSGRAGLDRLAEALTGGEMETAPASATSEEPGLPPHVALPRHARVVLCGDFLVPLGAVQAMIARFAAIPVTAHLVQVLDPAELSLPYEGRVRFRGLEQEGETLVPRVEAVRTAYERRLQAQQDGLRELCVAAGFGFTVHRTDHPPETALLALYAALSAK